MLGLRCEASKPTEPSVDLRTLAWIVGAALLCGCGTVKLAPAGDPSIEAMTVNGTSLVYESLGRATPAVVFVHGGFADRRIWEAQRTAVPPHHRYVALTLRYFGTGPWPDQGEQFSQETHVQDLVAFIRQLQSGPVVLVGRSYGAYTALVAAMRHPELVRGLVLNEPPIWSLLTAPAERAALADDLKGIAPVRAAAQAGRIDEATRQFADWVNAEPGGFDALPTVTQRMHLDNARTVPLQLATAARNVPITCEQLAQLTMPSVVTKGALSRPSLRLVADAISRCMPRSRLIDIPGARHDAPRQQPQAFNAVLGEFLAAL
jgi:pimeloyl-ACP methyl ester carboxylesterase